VGYYIVDLFWIILELVIFFYYDENKEHDTISILNSKQEAVKLSQDLVFIG